MKRKNVGETKPRSTCTSVFEKVDCTIPEFISMMSGGSVVCMRKDRGVTVVRLWWEDRDEWFCNVDHGKTTGLDGDVSWVIASDLPGYVRYLNESCGMSMCLENKGAKKIGKKK